MGFSYNVNVLNQKGSPALYTDTFANRPAAGYAGRLFIANDTSAIYEDTGTAWVLIANVSSGAGTLQQVTTNGNTSNVGISVTAGGISTNSLTDTALTLGSVLFAGAAGLVTQDNAAFYWDDTNNRLGINTVTPSNTLDIHFAGTGASVGINNTAGNPSTIVFANSGTNKWRIGNSSANNFEFYNNALASNAVSISTASNSVSFLASIKIQQGAGFAGVAGYNGIGCDSGGFFFELGTSTNNPYFNFIGLSAARTYTYPDASGTLSLTSDLSAYLPLSGGTLTGTLNGTNLSLTGYLTGSGSNPGGLGGSRYLIDYSGGYSRFFSYGINTSTNGGIIFNTQRSNGTNSIDAVAIVPSGNFLINSIVDDTINKLQVNGNAKVTKITSLEDNFTTIASGVTATLFTVAASQMYLCYVTQGATSVQVTFTVSVAEGSGTAIIGVLSTSGATLVISASGLNVQATNGAAPTITAKTTYIRIK